MKMRTKVLGGLCGAVLAAGAYKHELVYDLWLHEPTPQEAMIGDALLRAYGTETRVRCLEPESDSDVIADRMAPFGQRAPGLTHQGGALPRPLPKLIWLTQDMCDGLEQYAGREDKSAVSRFEITSLRAATHEMEHISWTYDEARTDCQAAQNGYLLPLAWGASEAQARHTGQRIANAIGDNMANLPSNYQLDITKCRDGGEWDLDPSQPGIFPEYPEQ